MKLGDQTPAAPLMKLPIVSLYPSDSGPTVFHVDPQLVGPGLGRQVHCLQARHINIT